MGARQSSGLETLPREPALSTRPLRGSRHDAQENYRVAVCLALGVEVEAWRDAVPFVSPPADGLSRALGVPLDLIEDAAAELGYVAAASANGGNQTMEGHTLRLGDA